MTTGNQLLPTTTAHQARLQIFQPSRRPQQVVKKEISTPWGSAIVEGKLGQQHADVLEAIASSAEKTRTLDGGLLQVLVDPYVIRKKAGGGQIIASDYLRKMLKEIRQASVFIDIPMLKIKILGGVIDEAVESPATKVNPLDGSDRHMMRVTFSKSWTMLFGQDLAVYYDVQPIAALKHGVSQAVARHVLTHRKEPNGGWVIDGLLAAVGIPEDGIAYRNKRRELRQDAPGLRITGILVNQDRICLLDKAQEFAIGVGV